MDPSDSLRVRASGRFGLEQKKAPSSLGTAPYYSPRVGIADRFLLLLLPIPHGRDLYAMDLWSASKHSRNSDTQITQKAGKA